jgi:Flp pilus assembly pilin Flp
MKPVLQRGQAMVEYILIVSLVALALFAPLGSNRPVGEVLALAIANFFRGFSFLVATS